MSAYNHELGIFVFQGEEEDVAFRFMWTCLMDLSWRGMIETIWRIIMKKPPERFFSDWNGVKKSNQIEHNKDCPYLQGKPVCTCQHLRRYN